jgi:hypothetical protein
MKGFRILFGMMAWGTASIACAVPLTPAQQAFADAQALAAGAQAGAAANVSGGSVASTVNQFNPTYYNANGTAPESALFQNGNGNTVSAGQSKVSNCATGAPNSDPFLQQNCEAINLMVNNPSNRPQIAIPPSLLAPSKAIVANANALAASSLGIADPNAVGAFSGCVNKTVTPPPTTEICNEFTGSTSQQCTLGQVVLVDHFTNYKCDKTNDIYLPQSCDKTLNAVVTAVNYCSISGSATGLGSYVQITSKRIWNNVTRKWITTTTSSDIVSPHFDVTFGCSGGIAAYVAVTINAGAQCHSFGCNSDYFPVTLNFVPGNNAGPVTQNLARTYKGVMWETTSVSYNGATNTVSISNSVNQFNETITATAVPTGTAGVRNDISSSLVNGCTVQEAAAL